MQVDLNVSKHIRKYFDLAYLHYEQNNWGLAVFFAITTIEECAKILKLRDVDLTDKKQRIEIFNHEAKYLSALINLIDSSDRFKALPKPYQEVIWSWFSDRKLMNLRDRGLYIWFNNDKRLTVPDAFINPKEAALFVFLSGFVAVELAEYVDLDSSWVNNIMQSTNAFRKKYLLI